MTLLMLCLGAALRVGGVVQEAPPMAAHSLLYATQAKQLRNVTTLDLSAPPVAAFFAELGTTAGINASRRDGCLDGYVTVTSRLRHGYVTVTSRCRHGYATVTSR